MSEPRIKSIPTKYRDVLMRSKLEARVAAKFDALGIEWSYEPEGYDLDGVWYLPDFWLPRIRTIVEVKGNLEGSDALLKPHLLSAALNAEFWDTETPNVIVVTEPWLRAPSAGVYEEGLHVLAFGQCVDGWQAKCRECKATWFLDSSGSFGCRACGIPGGSDHHIERQVGFSHCAECIKREQAEFSGKGFPT